MSIMSGTHKPKSHIPSGVFNTLEETIAKLGNDPRLTLARERLETIFSLTPSEFERKSSEVYQSV